MVSMLKFKNVFLTVSLCVLIVFPKIANAACKIEKLYQPYLKNITHIIVDLNHVYNDNTDIGFGQKNIPEAIKPEYLKSVISDLVKEQYQPCMSLDDQGVSYIINQSYFAPADDKTIVLNIGLKTYLTSKTPYYQNLIIIYPRIFRVLPAQSAFHSFLQPVPSALPWNGDEKALKNQVKTIIRDAFNIRRIPLGHEFPSSDQIKVQ